MLKSRVSTKPDFSRIAQALKIPGIDPRTWVCQGYVEAFGIDEEGPFIDAICTPSEETVPCRLASVYSGPGYGFFFPIEKDDEVLIFAPNGDPNAGLIAMPRPWSKSDPPPQDAIDNPTEILLHAKEGVAINFTVSGGAKVTFGNRDADENFVLGQQWKAMMEALFDAIAAMTHPTGVGPSGPPINVAAFNALKANLDAQLSDIIFGKKST